MQKDREISRDESLARQAIAAARKTDERFSVCIENLLDCFGIFSAVRDERGDITDFRIDYLNRAACTDQYLGLDQQLGRNLGECSPAYYKSGLFGQCKEVVETGRPFQSDSFIYRESSDQSAPARALDIRVCKLDDGVAVSWRDVTERIQKQRTVDEYRQRLELALGAGGMGIWEFHFHTNLLFWAPRTTFLMTGVEVERIIDADEFWKVVHPEDRPRYWEQVQSALENRGDMNADYRIIRSDGEIRRISSRATILRDAHNKPITVVGFITDITEQHAAAEALARRDLQHHAYFEYAPTSVAMVDTEMRYLAASRSFFSNYGVNPDFDPIGKCHYDVFNIPQHWKDVHARCLAGAVESCEQDAFVMPDGSTEWVRWEIRPWREPDQTIGGIIIFCELVTEKVRALASLQESEQKSRAFEALPQPAWFNYPDGTVAYFNDHWAQLTGASKIPQGDSWLHTYHPDDRERVIAIRNAGIAAQKPYTVEHRIRFADGSFHWHRSTVTPLRNADGSLFGWLGTAADIDQIRRAQQNADAANKAKDHFLAVLSHELRTPLTPVLTLAQMLEQDRAIPEAARESLSIIRRNVELETRLIDDLLDVTRIIRGKLAISVSRADLHDIINHSLDICREEIQARKLRVDILLEAARPTVSGDPARLQQVLWNLLKNATKFTPDEGSIRIATRNIPGKRPNAQDLLVTITDTGVGIDPAAINRLFQPFEQGDNVTQQFGGLGLGLAISKGIIDLHGGTLTAQSGGRNTGSTFQIRLPNAAPVGPTKAPQAAAPAAQRPLRILLVDDHADTRSAMKKLLAIDGHSVVSTGTVAEALAAANAYGFDLVISDIGLPDASGLDLMEQLARDHKLTGIAVSGFGMEEDLVRSRVAGFACHLTKPIHPDILRNAIASAVK